LFGGDKSAPVVIGLMSLTVSVLNVVLILTGKTQWRLFTLLRPMNI
jgi:hypothetical protein